jgi:hypothetical protein
MLAYSTQARNQVVPVKLRDLVISAKVGGSGGEGDSGHHGFVQDTQQLLFCASTCTWHQHGGGGAGLTPSPPVHVEI